jgi:phosphoadenosine phosphosulfate reductase
MPRKLDISEINKKMAVLTPIDRLKLAKKLFNNDIYALSSAGIDSSALLSYIKNSKIKLKILNIDSGFLPDETHSFKKTLEEFFNFSFITISPSPEVIDDIKKMELWEFDLEHYSKLTKVDPLNNFIRTNKVKALLSGARKDQSKNRQNLNYIDKDNHGIYRINPLLDMPEKEIKLIIKNNKLPRHPLYYKGYNSVGDKQTTSKGQKRQGRAIMECGINVLSGVPIISEN